jgi:hypothetical protein
VGLAQAELERHGIVTVSITALPEVTERVGVPRALEVPYRLGFPFGRPNDPDIQHRVLAALLALIVRTDVPLVERFTEPG